MNYRGTALGVGGWTGTVEVISAAIEGSAATGPLNGTVVNRSYDNASRLTYMGDPSGGPALRTDWMPTATG